MCVVVHEIVGGVSGRMSGLCGIFMFATLNECQEVLSFVRML